MYGYPVDLIFCFELYRKKVAEFLKYRDELACVITFNSSETT